MPRPPKIGAPSGTWDGEPSSAPLGRALAASAWHQLRTSIVSARQQNFGPVLAKCTSSSIKPPLPPPRRRRRCRLEPDRIARPPGVGVGNGFKLLHNSASPKPPTQNTAVCHRLITEAAGAWGLSVCAGRGVRHTLHSSPEHATKSGGCTAGELASSKLVAAAP